MTSEESNSEFSLKGKKFIEDCEVLGNTNSVTDANIRVLLNLWGNFRDGHKIIDFGDADQCLESLLICTSRLVLSVQYSKQISADYKRELKEIIVECGKTFSDSSHRKRLCEGISSIVGNPWAAPKFTEVVNNSSPKANKNEAAGALWDTEGWILLETRMEFLARMGPKVIDRLSSVLHVLVEKGHEMFRTNSNLVSENEEKSFHPYRFPYRKYVEYLEVYALLCFNEKVTTETVDLCEEWVLLDVISSLSEKITNVQSIRLFPKLKFWKNVNDAVKHLAKKATWKALKSERSMILKDFFTKWMGLSCKDNEEEGEHPDLKSLVDEVYKNIKQISCENVYKLAQFTVDIMGMTSFSKAKYVELFTAAMVEDISAIEELKTTQQENTDAIRDLDRKLSLRYLDLTNFFKEHPKTATDCLITAFCLNPCYKLYCLLFPNNTSEKENINNINDEDDFIPDKYNELKNIKFDHYDPTVEEELGLDSHVLGDLEIVIQNPRYKGLLGIESKDELRDICRSLLNFKSVTAIENKTLEHLDVDYEKYKDLKPQYDPDDDGIEKGYRPGERRNVPRTFSRISGSSLKARKNAIKRVRNLAIQGNSSTPRKGRPPKVKINDNVADPNDMFDRQIPNIALSSNPWFPTGNHGGLYVEFYHHCCSRDELLSKEDRQGRNYRYETRLINNVRLIQPERNGTPEIENLNPSSNNSVGDGSARAESSLSTELGSDATVPQLPIGSVNCTESGAMFNLGQNNPYYVDPTNGSLTDLLYVYQRQNCLRNLTDEGRNLSLQKQQSKRKKQQVMKNGKRLKVAADNGKTFNMEKSDNETNRRTRKFAEDTSNTAELNPSDLIDSKGTSDNELSDIKVESSATEGIRSSFDQVPPTEEKVISSPEPTSTASLELSSKQEQVLRYAGAFQIMGSYSKGDKTENEEAQCGEVSANESTGTTTYNVTSRMDQPFKGNTSVAKVSGTQANITTTVQPTNPEQFQDKTNNPLGIADFKPAITTAKPKLLKTYGSRRRLVVKTHWNSSAEKAKLDEYKSAMPIPVPVNDNLIHSNCSKTSLDSTDDTTELEPKSSDQTLNSVLNVDFNNSISKPNNIPSGSFVSSMESNTTMTQQVSEVTSLTQKETILAGDQIFKENETRQSNNTSETAPVDHEVLSSHNNDQEYSTKQTLSSSLLVNQHEEMESTVIEQPEVFIQNRLQRKQDLCEVSLPDKKENQSKAENAPYSAPTETNTEIVNLNEQSSVAVKCIDNLEKVGDGDQQKANIMQVGHVEQLGQVSLVQPNGESDNDPIILQQTLETDIISSSALESTKNRENVTPTDSTVDKSKQFGTPKDSTNTESIVKVSLKSKLIGLSHLRSLLAPKSKPVQNDGAKDLNSSSSSSASNFCDIQSSNEEKAEHNSNWDEGEQITAGIETKLETLSEQKDDNNQLDISTYESSSSQQTSADASQSTVKHCSEISIGTSNNDEETKLNEVKDGPPTFEAQVSDTFTEAERGRLITETEKCVEEPVEKLTEELDVTLTEELDVTLTEEPAEKLTEELDVTLTEEPVETLTEEPTETLTEEPTETLTEEPTETLTEKSVEVLAEKFVEAFAKGSKQTFTHGSVDALVEESAETFPKENSSIIVQLETQPPQAPQHIIPTPTSNERLSNDENEIFPEDPIDFPEQKSPSQVQCPESTDQSNENVGHLACHLQHKSENCSERFSGDFDAAKEAVHLILDTLDNKENVESCEKKEHKNIDSVSNESISSNIADNQLIQRDSDLITSTDGKKDTNIGVEEEKDDAAIDKGPVSPCNIATSTSNFTLEVSADVEEFNSQERQPVSSNSQTDEDVIEIIDLEDDDDINSCSGEEMKECFESAQDLATNEKESDGINLHRNSKLREVASSLLPHGAPAPATEAAPRPITPVSVLEDAINKKLKQKKKRPYEEEDRIKVAQSVVKHVEVHGGSLRGLLVCVVALEVIPPEILPEKARNQNPVKRSTRIRNKKFRVSDLIRNGNLFQDSTSPADNLSDQCASDSDSDVQVIDLEDSNSDSSQLLVPHVASTSQKCYSLTESSPITTLVCGTSVKNKRLQTARRGRPLPLKRTIDEVGLETSESLPVLLTCTPSKRKCGRRNSQQTSKTHKAMSSQTFNGFDSGSTTETEMDDQDENNYNSALPSRSTDVSEYCDANIIEIDGDDPLLIDDNVVPADINAYKNNIQIAPTVYIDLDSCNNDNVDVMENLMTNGDGVQPQPIRSSEQMLIVGEVEQSCTTSKECAKNEEDSDSDIEVIKEVIVSTKIGRGRGPPNRSHLSSPVKNSQLVTRNRQPKISSGRSTRLTTDQSSNNPSSSLSPDENIFVPENIEDVGVGAQEADQVSLSTNQEHNANVTFAPYLSTETVDNNYILPDAGDEYCLDDNNSSPMVNESGEVVRTVCSKDISISHRAVKHSSKVTEKDRPSCSHSQRRCHLQEITPVLRDSNLVTPASYFENEINSDQETNITARATDVQEELAPIQSVAYRDDTATVSMAPNSLQSSQDDITTSIVPKDVNQNSSKDIINDDDVIILEQLEINAGSSEESLDETSRYVDTSVDFPAAHDDVTHESNGSNVSRDTENENIFINFDLAVSPVVVENQNRDAPVMNVTETQSFTISNTATTDNCIAVDDDIVNCKGESLHIRSSEESTDNSSSLEIMNEQSVNSFTLVKNKTIPTTQYEIEDASVDELEMETNSNSLSDNYANMDGLVDEESHLQEHRILESENEETAAVVRLEADTVQSATNHIDLAMQGSSKKDLKLSVTPPFEAYNRQQSTLEATHQELELEHLNETSFQVVAIAEDQNEDNSLQNIPTNENSVDTEETEYENSQSDLTSDDIEFNVEESAMVQGMLFTVTESELNEIVLENNDCDESQDTFTTVPSPVNDILEAPQSPEIPTLAPETLTFENNSWLSDDEPPTLEIQEDIVL